ncbi:MAG: cupin domain-containing protein [Burkholderia gladioli]
MTIQIIHDTISTELGDGGPVAVPLSVPACITSGVGFDSTEAEGLQAGVWSCSEGSFQRQVESGEVMHILAGAGSFTTREGKRYDFKAGDTLYFPPNTHGAWQIDAAVRKVYVMV